MNESLKGLLTEEQYIDINKIANSKPEQGCRCDALVCDIECQIRNLKQAGIIRKSAFDELMEYVDKNIAPDMPIAHIDRIAELTTFILAYKAESEKAKAELLEALVKIKKVIVKRLCDNCNYMCSCHKEDLQYEVKNIDELIQKHQETN